MDTVRSLARRGRPMLVGGLALMLLVQLVPYGREHPNPPVVEAAPWPDPRAEQVFGTSCAACHSNTTRWPWYSHVAPASWLVTNDVLEGRDEFNASRWDDDDGEADDAVDAVLDGSMPPLRYVLAHPSARLTNEEQRVLIDALRAMDD